jgi:hypothetical protein
MTRRGGEAMAARRWCVVGHHQKVAKEAAVGGEQSGRAMARAGTLRNAPNSNLPSTSPKPIHASTAQAVEMAATIIGPGNVPELEMLIAPAAPASYHHLSPH